MPMRQNAAAELLSAAPVKNPNRDFPGIFHSARFVLYLLPLSQETRMAEFSNWEHFERYRRTASELSGLSNDEEAELARAFRKGDRRAGDRLIAASLRTVISIAREYRRWGIPLEDLVQQGNIGLLKAADRFDPTRENSLRAYASYWIRAEIRDYVVRSYRIVRLGSTRTERRAMRAFRAQQVESVEDLVKISGMPEQRCRKLWPLLAQSDKSLDAPGGGLDEQSENNLDSPEAMTIARQEHEQRRAGVRGALLELSERERAIVRARMMSETPATLEALGKKMGVSRERVRQLEKRAREKLAESLAPLVA